MLSASLTYLDLQPQKQRTCQIRILSVFNKLQETYYYLFHQVGSYPENSINILIIIFKLIYAFCGTHTAGVDIKQEH